MRLGSWVAVLLVMAGAGACDPSPSPSVGSESHFLRVCDGGCGQLSCVCGVCTEPCDPGQACAGVDASAQCVLVAARSAESLCPQAEVAAFCDLPCAEDLDCVAMGHGFFCREGYCREDPLYLPDEPFPGFGALCAEEAVLCSVATQAPSLIGSYTGEGRVVLSSNPLWNVGDTEPLVAVISGQDGGTLLGSIDLETLDLEVSGVVRGEGPQFSIYAPVSVENDGCNMEARVVVSGALDEMASPAALSGALALRFTGNFEGEGCTEEERTTYPGTGANFVYSAARGSGP